MRKIMVKKYRKQTAAFVLLLSVLAIRPAVAYSAPAWRGDERTTFQQWSFSEENYGPVNPDPGWDNDFGTPALYVGSGAEFVAGTWALRTDSMDLIIPNYPVIQPEKEIWVELRWRPAYLSFLPERPLIGIEMDIGYDRMEIEQEEVPPFGGNWVNTLYKINIWPNPTSEWISIRGDIYVDQVTVDTICIPEPATMTLLGLGILLGLRRKPNV